MAVVNTNISASLSQAALAKNDRALSKAMEQLSTGKKITSAADDAAGLAISTRMTSQIIGLEQSIGANDAISMVNTAEGALDEVTNLLQRMRELALQAANGTTDTADRSYLNKEYQNLYTEIDRIADNTEWNGRNILNNPANGNGSSLVEFQVGMNAGQTISVDFGFSQMYQGQDLRRLRIGWCDSWNYFCKLHNRSSDQSFAALSSGDTALTAISNQRATFGAVSSS